MLNKDYESNELNHQREKVCKPILPQWLIRLCRPSRMLWFTPLLGFMLTIPSFFSGYIADDHILRQNSSEKTIYSQRPDWDYFNFVPTDDEAARLRERGVYAWWTPDSYRIHFLRPLSSLVHTLQFRLFADAPWIMHIGLGLLYALTIFLCTRLLIGFSSTPFAAGAKKVVSGLNIFIISMMVQTH